MSFQTTQRYAQALYEVCESTGDFERVHGDLEKILVLIDKAADFRDFIQSPVIPKQVQENVIDEAFGKKVCTATLKFLHFLIYKGRLNLLKEICSAFGEIYLKAKNIAKVDVFSSVALDDHQLSTLKKHLKENLKKEIQTRVVIEPGILGGVKVRVGDEIFDHTIQTQLEEFRSNYQKAF